MVELAPPIATDYALTTKQFDSTPLANGNGNGNGHHPAYLPLDKMPSSTKPTQLSLSPQSSKQPAMTDMVESPTSFHQAEPFGSGSGLPPPPRQAQSSASFGAGVRSNTAPTALQAGNWAGFTGRPQSMMTDESYEPDSTPLQSPYPLGQEPGPSRLPIEDSPPRSLHPKSLSHYISQHPDATVKEAVSKTYPRPNPILRLVKRFQLKHDIISGLSEEKMKKWEDKEGERARRDAGWGKVIREGGPEGGMKAREEISRTTVKPGPEEKPDVSELFWKMYVSLLPTLQRDPFAGLVLPPLLGSTATMPVTIISLIPDIMRHYRDVIVRAEKEIFLVTNYWQPSNSVDTISGALKELSAKIVLKQQAGEKAEKVIVKLIYDRGSFEQLYNSHAPVAPDGWEVLKIPMPAEIPGLDLEVVNYHRVLLGTFHAKFMIVDRKVALLNSNNIQDRPNLELMTHLEGPIVDSFYEVALHSWYNKLSPMMPCAGTAYRPPPEGYHFGDANPYLRDIEVLKAARAARRLLRRETAAEFGRSESPHRFRDVVRLAMERAGNRAGASWDDLFTGREGDDRERQDHRLSHWADRVMTGFTSRSPSRRASLEEKRLMVRRASAPVVQQTHTAGTNGSDNHEATIQGSPTLNGDSTDLPKTAQMPPEPKVELESGWKRVRLDLPEVIAKGGSPPKQDMKVAGSGEKENGDLLKSNGDAHGNPPQSDTSPTLSPPSEGQSGHHRSGSERMVALSQRLNAGANSEAWATVEDTDDLDTFQPHVIHKPHKPFPIAMCNRKPHGMPGHHDIRNPQNAAWLAGCRYAQKKIWIQTPTLNARPIRRAIKHACRRGVDVTLFLDLGFNDQGESIPFQGGTNEQVVERLYGILRKEKKEQFLKVYWYTGKDQIRPLNAVHKQRNCHIKFAMFDDQVAILGNGNQDTQSWMHSQETNVMIDSKEIVAELMEVLLSNQNTHISGLVGTDGIWRDKDGYTVNHYDGTKKSKHPGLEGFMRFAKSI